MSCKLGSGVSRVPSRREARCLLLEMNSAAGCVMTTATKEPNGACTRRPRLRVKLKGGVDVDLDLLKVSQR